jgi:hypothetical protein
MRLDSRSCSCSCGSQVVAGLVVFAMADVHRKERYRCTSSILSTCAACPCAAASAWPLDRLPLPCHHQAMPNVGTAMLWPHTSGLSRYPYAPYAAATASA